MQKKQNQQVDEIAVGMKVGTGVVIYVHPLRRYFEIEYTNSVTGEKYRDTLYFTGNSEEK